MLKTPSLDVASLILEGYTQRMSPDGHSCDTTSHVVHGYCCRCPYLRRASFEPSCAIPTTQNQAIAQRITRFILSVAKARGVNAHHLLSKLLNKQLQLPSQRFVFAASAVDAPLSFLHCLNGMAAWRFVASFVPIPVQLLN